MLSRYDLWVHTSRVSVVGTALADPKRAEILAALVSGTAHTAGELANAVGLAPSTTSRHLSRLVDTGLLTVEPSGRHRYFRIASKDVADLLEWIDGMELPETNPPQRPRPGSELSYARSCYDHLAGELGVSLYQAMVNLDLLLDTPDQPTLTPAGGKHLHDLGIDVDELTNKRRPLTRACIDWTQRTHHLGGAVGVALLQHMLTEQWLRRSRDGRVLKLTDHGRTAFLHHFDLKIVVH